MVSTAQSQRPGRRNNRRQGLLPRTLEEQGEPLEYDRLIGEWWAAGRPSQLLKKNDGELTIIEMIAAYWRHTEAHYVKDGRQTSEVDGMKTALRFSKQG